MIIVMGYRIMESQWLLLDRQTVRVCSHSDPGRFPALRHTEILSKYYIDSLSRGIATIIPSFPSQTSRPPIFKYIRVFHQIQGDVSFTLRLKVPTLYRAKLAG